MAHILVKTRHGNREKIHITPVGGFRGEEDFAVIECGLDAAWSAIQDKRFEQARRLVAELDPIAGVEDWMDMLVKLEMPPLVSW